VLTRPARAGTDKLVIKAQVLAGGRGKGKFDTGLQGGVHMVSTCVPLRRAPRDRAETPFPGRRRRRTTRAR
jgi:succinyl-CoA synthetase beta subunit